MKRTGFTMLELVISIAILAIMAAALTLNLASIKFTAKHEAERLAAKISSLMLKADKTRTHFQINLYENKIRFKWNNNYSDIKNDKNFFIEDFEAGKGCSFSWNAPSDVLYYSYITNKFSQGATITVKCEEKNYYVIIATIGSRVRVSDTKPES